MAEREITLTRADPNAEQGAGQWRRVDGLDAPVSVYVLLVPDQHRRSVVCGVAAFGDTAAATQPVTAAHLRDLPLGQVEATANRPSDITAEQLFRELGPLSRQPTESAGTFYARVAWYYQVFAAAGPSPAKAIADKYDIPVRRVRFWIAEARRLGKLPPGRQGKTG